MHRLAAIAGEWNPNTGTESITGSISGNNAKKDTLNFVEQQPAAIVIITAADTDIQTLSATVSQLDSSFPTIRAVNLLQLQQQMVIDTYAEEVLAQARMIILRLIGGQSYWSYGLEVVKATAAENGTILIVLPGDERPDPNLISHSTVDLRLVNQIWRYFIEAGVENYLNLLKFIANEFLDFKTDWQMPCPVSRVGIYTGWQSCLLPNDIQQYSELSQTSYQTLSQAKTQTQYQAKAKAGILFYRAHYLSGNIQAIAALCEGLYRRNIFPVPIYVSSLREPDVQTELISICSSEISILLNTTSFSLASLETESPQVDLWESLNVPVFQVIFSGSGRATWLKSLQGLTPRDMAMNVVLPEVDGRIITRAVSFKIGSNQDSKLQTEVVVYQPEPSRIEFVAELTANWLKLKHTAVSDRKVGLILANYPNRNGRIANGVGLDTPESCVEILKALQIEGYNLNNSINSIEIPEDGDRLIQLLTKGITNDLETSALKIASQSLSLADYKSHFAKLPQLVQDGILNRWGEPDRDFSISGIQFGHIFVGIQPPRGYDRDPSLNYHAPDLEPTHEYLAFYLWLRIDFGVHAIAHVGKHGNLEWLPGKSIALSENCYPEAVFGAMPHLYPFIVNDPGEGSQAKRRSQAIIIDHLTPPMTRAELYGGMQALEALIDEYYEAQTLDPERLGLIRDRLKTLIIQENLHLDLGISLAQLEDTINTVLTTADGYLCELKEAQIRDGLHIFGKCPEGRQLRDLIVAIARSPHNSYQGLTRAIAQDWNLDFDPLTADLSKPFLGEPFLGERIEPNSNLINCRIIGDALEQIEDYAAELVEASLNGIAIAAKTETAKELAWIDRYLIPALKQTDSEITNFLRGLNGEYIPSGASGAPTRSKPEVLPTGRNFYSVDIRAVPTQIAWDLGRKAAELLIEAYTQEHGEYPKTLGLSIWGTSTMRTGGDDIAEALALLGVRPKWDNRRVIDFEILPLSVLGRPRVDVTLRISGFFRDAFPNLIDLFDSAVNAVANLDEPPEQNPLAAQVALETEKWQQDGLDLDRASERSRYRVFGSKPSAYGAGLQGLIESQNWQTDADLAQAYINWSAYAYTKNREGKSAPEAFCQRLQKMEIVLQNQDNREHDLLDSDDYYQFQGGMTAAVKLASGAMPEIYFGDHSRIEQPKVRKLTEEISRVYRSRVVNPKWIAGVMRHGYKGAFEMSATLDYLFAYDATTNCVSDFMYEGIASAYLFDPKVQQFLQNSNPWSMRDLAERLLEANQRGMWKDAAQLTLDRLREIVHQAEEVIESGIN
jgi:cobaltochelatase CobN